ncbi:MAG: ATP-binding protein [Agathobacter sp.]|nr:ATP-binding protein [Agathobacter sp.]
MFKNTKFVEFIKSLRFRLLVILLAVAIIPATLLGQILLNAYKARAIAIKESEISSQATILADQIATSGYLEEYKSVNDINMTRLKLQMDMLTTIYEGRIIVVNKDYRIISDSYDLDTDKMIVSEEVVNCFEKATSSVARTEEGFIEKAFPIVNRELDSNEVLGVVVVSVSTNNIELNYEFLSKIAMILDLVMVVVAILLGGLAINAALLPMKKLSDNIARIHAGYGDDSLEINDCTEIKKICDSFNSVLSEMRVMDQSRQEFVSNVSHELKTPLTSMKVLADSLNSMPDAPIELYQEFMEDITNEIERENKIITDLLSLVKMDKTAADMNIETLNINDLVEQIIKRLQPIADKQQVAIVLESFRPVTAEVDDVKLTLAITNLIENAIKYNKNDGTGWVRVSLNADHQYFYLKVEDSGMGIPEESLDNIYERFYRVDKSHSREIGGTGLGLAITRNSVLMHRGAIKVHSILGKGTTFDVRIPLSYIL